MHFKDFYESHLEWSVFWFHIKIWGMTSSLSHESSALWCLSYAYALQCNELYGIQQVYSYFQHPTSDVTACFFWANFIHPMFMVQMGDMETLYKSKVEQLKQEIMEKEAGLQKVYEDFEQKHLDQCEQLEQRASKIPKDKVLNDEMQQQQTQYYSLPFCHYVVNVLLKIFWSSLIFLLNSSSSKFLLVNHFFYMLLVIKSSCCPRFNSCRFPPFLWFSVLG